MKRSPLRAGSLVLSRLVLFLGVSVLAGVLLAGIALPALGGVGLVARGSASDFEKEEQALQINRLAQRSRILDADGRTLATFYYQNRVSVPLSRVAPVMQQAVVAIEDSRFYKHKGVDIRGTARAFVRNQSGSSVQGGSTLTQQLVKNLLLESAAARGDKRAQKAATERSYSRKLRELKYALQLEKQMSKAQILEDYLNIALFGGGAYGVEAAAHRYFGKSAKDLTLPEAATLAGIVRSPGAYDPLRFPAASLARRNVVLTRMAELGTITPAAAARAKRTRLVLHPTTMPNGCSTSYAPYFCDFVVETLKTDPAFAAKPADRLALLQRGGLTIRTTLDPTMQEAAQKAVDSRIPRKDKSGIATVDVMVQPGTGAIKAMAQNRSWGTDRKRGVTSINYAVERAYGGSAYGWQAGSTFKAFTAAAAIQKGIPISTRINSPKQRVFTGFRNCETGARYAPYPVRNSTKSGTFTMAEGLAYSVNTWAVGLEERVGICAPVELAESLGLRLAHDNGPLERVPSFTLGTQTVAPLRMAEAYATFAARGQHCRAYPITGITDRDGKAVRHTEPECEQAMEAGDADAVNSLLKGVIDGPLPGRTGRSLSLGRPAAGKTGTTDDNRDVWFIGYTPTLASAVWVGDPGRVKHGQIERRRLQNITIGGRRIEAAHGSTVAGPIWEKAMREVLKGTPKTDFTSVDPGLLRGASVTVPDVSGMKASKAAETLGAQGLLSREGPTVRSGGMKDGRVVFTSPRAGARVDSGQTVVLYLSGRGGGQFFPVTQTAP